MLVDTRNKKLKEQERQMKKQQSKQKRGKR